ncbi:MAG: type VI secretion system baseplate subunit TssG [Chitinophagaceae bacterium]|nr:type VI secretion system baseplate subunit TssG [Rubrivivax sp.]
MNAASDDDTVPAALAAAPEPEPEPDLEPAPQRAPSALQRLQREPTRFSIDQAVAVLAPGRDPVDVAYISSPRLGAPGGEVVQARPETSELVTPTFGLIGPGGVLPRQYTARVDAELRKRSTALRAFLELLGRRFTGLFVKAGAKHRPTRDPQLAERVQAAVVGLGTPHLAPSLTTPLSAVLYHAGGLAARSRSVERLRGMLSEETGAKVEIVEFAGGWVRLPENEQSRLAAPGQPGCYVQLGVDAAIGSQVWDPPARFLVRLGPLNLHDFNALLPGTPLHARLVELTRLHVGPEQDFAFNPTLFAAEVPPLQLTAAGTGGARLGWTSWLTAARPRRVPAAAAMLQPMNA